jgi:hypothetical protein
MINNANLEQNNEATSLQSLLTAFHFEIFNFRSFLASGESAGLGSVPQSCLPFF